MTARSPRARPARVADKQLEVRDNRVGRALDHRGQPDPPAAPADRDQSTVREGWAVVAGPEAEALEARQTETDRSGSVVRTDADATVAKGRFTSAPDPALAFEINSVGGELGTLLRDEQIRVVREVLEWMAQRRAEGGREKR